MKCTCSFLPPPRQATSQQLDTQYSNPDYVRETKAVLYCIGMFREPADQDTVAPSIWFLACSQLLPLILLNIGAVQSQC